MDAVRKALATAKADDSKPWLIACKTVIGYGAPKKAGTAATHGSPLGAEEIAGTRAKLGWTSAPFEIPADILKAWRAAGARGHAAREAWEARWNKLDGRVREAFENPDGGACSGRQRGRHQSPRRGGDRYRRARDARVVREIARSAGRGSAGADRRLGGSHRLQQHQGQGAEADRQRRFRRQLSLLRHPRARHGRGHERHGAVRRPHPLRRHVPRVLGLLPAVDPPCRADEAAGRLRLHARLDRARRGRADASAGRASGGAARDPEPQRVPSGRWRRDGGMLGARGRATAVRPRCLR